MKKSLMTWGLLAGTIATAQAQPAPLPPVADEADDRMGCMTALFNETSGNFKSTELRARSNGEFATDTTYFALDSAGPQRWHYRERDEADSENESTYLTLHGTDKLNISVMSETGEETILYTATITSCTKADQFGRRSYASEWVTGADSEDPGFVTRSGIFTSDYLMEEIKVVRESGVVGTISMLAARLEANAE